MFQHGSAFYRESTNIITTPTGFRTGVQSTGSPQTQVSVLHISAPECNLQGVDKHKYHSYIFRHRSAIYRESTNISITPTCFANGVIILIIVTLVNTN